MSYSVFILPGAQKELSGLQAEDYDRVKSAILALENEPRPTHCRKLVGREGWRIRVRSYRVIYEIDDMLKRVLVLQVGHRRDIYRRH